MKATGTIGSLLLLVALAAPAFADNTGQSITVASGGKSYASYLAASAGPGRKPGILVHSFNGLEQGNKDLVDRFAADGFVVLALGWQTFDKSPRTRWLSSSCATALQC